MGRLYDLECDTRELERKTQEVQRGANAQFDAILRLCKANDKLRERQITDLTDRLALTEGQCTRPDSDIHTLPERILHITNRINDLDKRISALEPSTCPHCGQSLPEDSHGEA